MSHASSIPITLEYKEALQVFLFSSTKKTQQRGQALASKRHVLSIKRNEKMLEAVVLGSDKLKSYSVHLAFQSGGVIGDCTCPYGSHCKHAVAVAKLLIHEAPIAEAPVESNAISRAISILATVKGVSISSLIREATEQYLMREDPKGEILKAAKDLVEAQSESADERAKEPLNPGSIAQIGALIKKVGKPDTLHDGLNASQVTSEPPVDTPPN